MTLTLPQIRIARAALERLRRESTSPAERAYILRRLRELEKLEKEVAK